MNPNKPQMLLAVSVLLSLFGLFLFNSIQVTEPTFAQIAPTPTPRRLAPNSPPPFKYYFPFVAGPPDSFTLINQDLANGVIDLNQATTFKFYALFKSPLLPAQYQSNAAIPYDGTGAFISTLSNWDQLNSSTQQTLAGFLNPQSITAAPSAKAPMQQGTRIVGCDLLERRNTAHFTIWYSGIDPRCRVSGQLYVDTIALGLEDAWNRYSAMNYNMPVSSTVYIIPAINLPNASALTLPSGILFPNNLQITIPDLPALAAHEFFHTVQWRYFGGPNISCLWAPATQPPTWLIPFAWLNNEDVRWRMESSAQWAQHEVYPNDRSYYVFLRSYLDSPWKHMDTRPIEGGTGFPYGSVLFPIFITETLPARAALIRTIWDRYSQMNNGCGVLVPAMQSTLQSQGTTMEQLFPRFAETNYSLAYQNQADFRTRPDIGADFRPNPESRGLNDQVPSVSGPIRTDGRQIEHLGATYIEFQNLFPQPAVGRALTITTDIYIDNTTVDPVVKFWAIQQYTPTVISKTITPNFQLVETIGSTRHYVAKAGVLGFDSYKWVAMMLVNPKTSGTDITYTYSAGVIPPAVIYAGGNSKGFVSTNGGASWITYTFPSTTSMQAITAITNTQGLVGYVGTSDLRLWKTTNAGQSFTPTYNFTSKVPITTTTSGHKIALVEADPNNANVVYVGVRWNDNTKWIVGRDNAGALFKSTDGGQTFGNDILYHNGSIWIDGAIYSLAIDPRNSNIL